jgi:hypothetical protein
MLRKLALAGAACSLLGLAAVSQGPEVGTSYCFGVNCQCGNNDPSGGCANSTGVGGRLVVTTGNSVLADDAVFEAWNLPTAKTALIIVSQNQRNAPFGDGRMCVGPDLKRVRTHFNTGQTGSVTATGVLETLAEYGTLIQSGETWHVQVWFRDPDPNWACNGTSTRDNTNLTNAYTVTFAP